MYVLNRSMCEAYLGTEETEAKSKPFSNLHRTFHISLLQSSMGYWVTKPRLRPNSNVPGMKPKMTRGWCFTAQEQQAS